MRETVRRLCTSVCRHVSLIGLAVVAAWPAVLAAQEETKSPTPAAARQQKGDVEPRANSAAKASADTDAAGGAAAFRTVETAITATIRRGAGTARPGQSGFLGIEVKPDDGGRLIVAEVATASAAEQAGLRPGDRLVEVDGHVVQSAELLRGSLQSRVPGESIKLAILRDEEPMEIAATLGATSRPMQLSAQRATIGLRLGELKDGQGVAIEQITPNSPAAKAGLKVGELVVKLDGSLLTDRARLSDALAERRPGDTVTLEVRRTALGPPTRVIWGWRGQPTVLVPSMDFRVEELSVQLAADTGRGGGPGNWDDRPPPYFKKEVYRLAVIGIEYSDAKHSDKITTQDWENAFFSRETFTDKNATGQRVFGSMNDYFHEQSFGTLRVEGKMFDWVEVSKMRMAYSEGSGTGNKSVLLAEALDKLLERDGSDALKDFDGMLFLYAGGRVQTVRGGIYWPHRASFSHKGKRWSYFIVNEGDRGDRMATISVFCHEFGHMLGLPDLYARPENPGSEGLGAWCAMSNQINNGRPQHFSAWCKEQLGWIQPAVIDPTVKQRLVLGPIEDSAKECFKVLVKPDGSEYLLLENRRKKGFDQDLPAEGLLIWRVVQRRPLLEESHGVEGPAGPRVFSGAVPYPSTANNSYTPFTTPSSRSQLGGGLPVYITNIHRLDDGRITFEVGYEYQ